MCQREQAKYSDFDRAAALTALEANGGNIQKTAQQQGIPTNTLWEWAKGRHNADVTIIKEKMTVELADRMEQLAQSCLNLLTPVRLEAASAAQLSTIMGIAVDKMQVLRGKPDSIMSTETLTNEDRLERLQELMQKMADRKAMANAEAQENGME